MTSTRLKADSLYICLSAHRWDDLDDSPVTWHIVGDIAGAAADNGAGFDPFITEPWQLAVNGIY